MNQPLRGVMIGAGFFAQFHAEAWKRVPGVDLAAVADPAPGKARAFAEHHGIGRAFESVAEMLAAERPDFVDVVTRPETHLELTRFVAAHGFHVICQKPMAPAYSDCVAMCQICEAAGVRLFIHENWRWQPWYREANCRVDAGALGALQRLAFDWRTGDGQGPRPYPAQPYFRTMPRLLIYESLVHILDTFRFLGGELRITACAIQRINPVIAGEDWSEIHAVFAGGATGFIHGDRHTGPNPAPVAMGSLTLEGERATLRVTGSGHLRLVQPGGAEEMLAFRPPTAGYKGDSVLATQQHIVDCLRTGQISESEGRDYLPTVALVEECYRRAGA